MSSIRCGGAGCFRLSLCWDFLPPHTLPDTGNPFSYSSTRFLLRLKIPSLIATSASTFFVCRRSRPCTTGLTLLCRSRFWRPPVFICSIAGIQYTPQALSLTPRARTHLLILIAAILLVKSAGYLLDTFELLYSRRGAAFGASYADVYASLPVLRFMALLALMASGLCLAQIYRPGFKYILVGGGGLLLAHVVGLNLYPSLLQRFGVIPNEIVTERPFIERSIQFTRRAYGLDKVESVEFPAEEKLTAADLKRNDATIKNIRLWEHRPLLATLGQLQEIRTYYKFVDVDNDRYQIDGDLPAGDAVRARALARSTCRAASGSTSISRTPTATASCSAR